MVWLRQCLSLSFVLLFSLVVQSFDLPAGVKKIEFKTKTIEVGGHRLPVELAESEEQITRGLMYRLKKDFNGNRGMLFVFKDQRIRRFWTKNTFAPLSIGYFDANKRLIDIHKMKPVKSEMEQPSTYTSSAPAMYALEVPQGWFEQRSIFKKDLQKKPVVMRF